MFNKLIELFLKFPGIGPRQAKRFAYFLASQEEKFLEELSNEILNIKRVIKRCPLCFKLHGEDKNECRICNDINREKNILMVVEKEMDLENIEKSGAYNGKYFVIGSLLPLNGEGLDNLRFKSLFERVKKENIYEVILALSANTEGENTSRYIIKILEPLKVKITKLGRGLSTGTELEYSDSETIKNALDNRK